jgi:hypothetical protein
VITHKHLSCGSAASGRMATTVGLRSWPEASLRGARSSKSNTLARRACAPHTCPSSLAAFGRSSLLKHQKHLSLLLLPLQALTA